MTEQLTHRQTIVLSALASEEAAEFAPVQVQKLFFLLDEKLSGQIGGKQFSFRPYDYGPFDASVYHELEQLRARGLVRIDAGHRGLRRYSLTQEGITVGQNYLSALPEIASAYMKKASRWVRSLSFAELVGSIYKAFPEMRVNSIFVEQ